jgi:hypothetical protein
MSETNFNKISQQIISSEERINARMDIIETKLNELMAILNEDISKSCSKMSGHINFVENVYDTIKSPLTFICNKVNVLTGAETMELTNVSYDLEDDSNDDSDDTYLYNDISN